MWASGGDGGGADRESTSESAGARQKGSAFGNECGEIGYGRVYWIENANVSACYARGLGLDLCHGRGRGRRGPSSVLCRGNLGPGPCHRGRDPYRSWWRREVDGVRRGVGVFRDFAKLDSRGFETGFMSV